MMARRLALLVIAGAAAWPFAAGAQSYPTRPITMVVPYAAGGVFDTIARIVGVRMGELLGQSVIVENVTGAGGIIGVQRVIGAKADGYTLLLGTVGTHAYNQSIYRKRRYDAVNDFTPVTLFSDQPMVLEARKDLPASNLAGIHRAAQAERREDDVRLRRRRIDHASCLRAAQCEDRGRGDPRSLSRWRACRK